MSAAQWDERYRKSELMWGAAPNRWVAQEVGGMPAGRALDLACGEGRNAIWLATLGWQVTAVDFSAVAIDKGRSAGAQLAIDWRVADATTYEAPPADLVLMVYLQLPRDLRRAAFARATSALAPGGVLLVVGHDSRNLAEGVGGPQDPDVLFSPADVRDDLAVLGDDSDGEFVLERAEQLFRAVPDAPRPAIDALVRIRRRGEQ